MFAPIYRVCDSSSEVKALLGSNTVEDQMRIYAFGDAPQNVKLPYAVWQNVSGSPINYISNAPDSDHFGIQVDVYGSTRESVRSVVRALNAALEVEAHITRWGNENRDATTRSYHFDFDVEFITER